ncbi:MAG: hypothetical protein M1824_000393 [Vezdaea acicularis]|nr:MAG: hypothetical protein M1824_000393 [Vezdaea acicularis]
MPFTSWKQQIRRKLKKIRPSTNPPVGSSIGQDATNDEITPVLPDSPQCLTSKPTFQPHSGGMSIPHSPTGKEAFHERLQRMYGVDYLSESQLSPFNSSRISQDPLSISLVDSVSSSNLFIPGSGRGSPISASTLDYLTPPLTTQEGGDPPPYKAPPEDQSSLSLYENEQDVCKDERSVSKASRRYERKHRFQDKANRIPKGRTPSPLQCTDLPSRPDRQSCKVCGLSRLQHYHGDGSSYRSRSRLKTCKMTLEKSWWLPGEPALSTAPLGFSENMSNAEDYFMPCPSEASGPDILPDCDSASVLGSDRESCSCSLTAGRLRRWSSLEFATRLSESPSQNSPALITLRRASKLPGFREVEGSFSLPRADEITKPEALKQPTLRGQPASLATTFTDVHSALMPSAPSASEAGPGATIFGTTSSVQRVVTTTSVHEIIWQDDRTSVCSVQSDITATNDKVNQESQAHDQRDKKTLKIPRAGTEVLDRSSSDKMSDWSWTPESSRDSDGTAIQFGFCVKRNSVVAIQPRMSVNECLDSSALRSSQMDVALFHRESTEENKTTHKTTIMSLLMLTNFARLDSSHSLNLNKEPEAGIVWRKGANSRQAVPRLVSESTEATEFKPYIKRRKTVHPNPYATARTGTIGGVGCAIGSFVGQRRRAKTFIVSRGLQAIDHIENPTLPLSQQRSFSWNSGVEELSLVHPQPKRITSSRLVNDSRDCEVQEQWARNDYSAASHTPSLSTSELQRLHEYHTHYPDDSKVERLLRKNKSESFEGNVHG